MMLAEEQKKGRIIMSADARKEYASTMVFIILGLLALYGDTRWLLALIPVAVLVWFAARATTFRRRRN
ncbi:MAG: hypothetical protein WAN63_02365 [Candidatus Sulfotelmatobacter sp.]